MTGLTVERRVASCRARRGVARRIGFADVGLDFDDGSARLDAMAAMDEDLAQQIAGNVEGRTIVEGAEEFHGPHAAGGA